jgi:hypothetical protein
MPISVRWNEAEKRIVIQEFVGKWSLEEYYESAQIVVDEVKSQSHIVHIIGDLRNSASIPPGILGARSFLERTTPPNRGLIVVVGANSLLMMLIDIVRPVAPRFVNNLYFSSSPEDAFRLIAEWDSKHNPQP